MSTALSALTPYCTPAQLLQFHDARQIGDLIGDANQRINAQAILTDANVNAALMAASGELESACLVGGKYSVIDLGTTLNGVSQVLLQELVAELAYWKLWKRRKGSTGITEGFKWAHDLLQQLREGERIFGLLEVANANSQPTIDDQTIGQIQALDLTSYQAQRYFGQRANVNRQLGPPQTPLNS